LCKGRKEERKEESKTMPEANGLGEWKNEDCKKKWKNQ
jgi:hypothetical protein